MRYLNVAGEHVMGEPVGGVLRHATLFYRSQSEYADRIADAGLDAMPGELAFLDATELSRNPARIIPEVLSFIDKHPGQRVRCVGEPIWPGRSPAEICEAARHEALVNLVFARAQ